MAFFSEFVAVTFMAAGCDEGYTASNPNCIAWKDGGPFQHSSHLLVIVPAVLLMVGASVYAVRRRRRRWIAIGALAAVAYLMIISVRGEPFYPWFW